MGTQMRGLYEVARLLKGNGMRRMFAVLVAGVVQVFLLAGIAQAQTSSFTDDWMSFQIHKH